MAPGNWAHHTSAQAHQKLCARNTIATAPPKTFRSRVTTRISVNVAAISRPRHSLTQGVCSGAKSKPRFVNISSTRRAHRRQIGQSPSYKIQPRISSKPFTLLSSAFIRNQNSGSQTFLLLLAWRPEKFPEFGAHLDEFHQ